MKQMIKLQEAVSMSEFKNLKRIRNDFYDGPPLESGGTSIPGKGASPGIRFLYDKGHFKNCKMILDYGAGKYARNADYLREQGFQVYAYDPYNGSNVDGFEMGNVSNELPDGRFDCGFSSFVLNVVPFYIEESIVNELKRYARKTFHITRNKDIFDMVVNAVERNEPIVMEFYNDDYRGNTPPSLTDIYDFCCYGIATSRGFQRIPTTSVLGYNLINATSGFKIYGE